MGRSGHGTHLAKELGRPLLEIVVMRPAGVHERPIQMVLGHLFKCPGRCSLLAGQAAIEIEAILFFDVPANQRGIGDALAVVVDIRQFALGSLAKSAAVGAIGEASHFQECCRLGNERLGSGRPNAGPKL
jgi:hypothetical protein